MSDSVSPAASGPDTGPDTGPETSPAASLAELGLEPAPVIEVDEAPVPPGAEFAWLKTSDDARLRVAAFPTPRPAAEQKGTIVLLNGRCEIIEKYVEVVADLLQRGFNVATLDWRGQGLSSRMLPMAEKGHIKTFGTYLADLKLFLKKCVLPRFAGPYVAMSHSMGGVPLLQLLAEGETRFACAVLSSPMTRLFRPVATRHTVRLMADNAVRLGLGQRMIFGVAEHSMKFEGNNLSSDRQRHEMFRKLLESAPNAAVHAPTYGWLKAAFDAMDAINAPGALDNISVPVLIVASGNDSTVDGTNAVRLAGHYERIETVVVPGALHEILMERDIYRDRFWQAFDGFTGERLDAALSAKPDGPHSAAAS